MLEGGRPRPRRHRARPLRTLPIARLKKDGADVRVSFGGASGKEPAAACDSVTELAAAYAKALDAAGSTRADFDTQATFTLADAAQVRTFAARKNRAWVSMWSAFRDRRCRKGASGQDDAATDCSGVAQSSGAFARAFSG